ncbi:glycosyltransferase, partial [Rosenbergiella epipactidis]|uniref:glycosyltransferase n=1 Tax=Rosenbergiella epipactidis TaxID=1544694 RepID=UPI001F4E4F61
MKIGIVRDDYPEKRCITTNREYSYVNLNKNNYNAYLKKIPLINKIQLDYVYKPIVDFKVDLYHTFNYICCTNKNWVVTFETMLPRFVGLFNDLNNLSSNKLIEEYLIKIADNNCLAVLPISECTRKIQETILNHYPEIKDKIMGKTHVIFPPQIPLTDINSIRERNSDIINFLFVGKDFYRKGGAEIVLAFDELLRSNEIDPRNVCITLVGDINRKYNYALGDFQYNEVFFKHIESLIEKHQCFNVINDLSNSGILDLMLKSHVGLLPTWADTFGYSVLEFQASGCPVITSDVRALTEINNDDTGWIIETTKDNLGSIKIKNETDRDLNQELLVAGIKRCILEVINNKTSIHKKGISSLSRIKKYHDPSIYNT